MEYTNRFGTATLTQVGPIVHVKTIDGATVIDDGYGFDVDTAMKLALITENARVSATCVQHDQEATLREVLHHTRRARCRFAVSTA